MAEKSQGYYNTPEENFKHAYDLIISNQSHAELINMLENGNIVQKQLAALKLENIFDENEAQVLIDNLTGQDGKVREAVALKIFEFMQKPEFAKLFKAQKNCDRFLAAIIDINGNICRNIISALTYLKNDTEFCKVFTSKLMALTLDLADKVKDFDFQDGKYKVNKEVFKLYWYLETIYRFVEFTELEPLKKIINITKSINEYTIREKTAKILTHDFRDEELNQIRQLLKNDTNYYVRRF